MPSLTPAIALGAVRGVRDHQLGYYDAQIWAAAQINQISLSSAPETLNNFVPAREGFKSIDGGLPFDANAPAAATVKPDQGSPFIPSHSNTRATAPGAIEGSIERLPRR